MANFGIAARTLIHLGAELITSDEIAIFELIKNSFDAESKSVSVRFCFIVPYKTINSLIELVNDKDFSINDNSISIIREKLISSKINELMSNLQEYFDGKLKQLGHCKDVFDVVTVLEEINFIQISDTGNGMDAVEMESVFLTVGTPSKLNKKHENGDVFLGNKGIGRLAMMRLGGRAVVESTKRGSAHKERITFDWRHFEDSSLMLHQIEFPLDKVLKENLSDQGTVINIYATKRDWSQSDIEAKVIGKFLRRLRNPFEDDAKYFGINVTFNDGKRIAIPPLDEDLLKLADRNLTLDFFPGDLSNPLSPIIKTIVDNPARPEEEPTIVVRSVDDVCRKFSVAKEDLARLGPFQLKLSWFNRRNMTKQGLGSKLKLMKDELDLWCGGVALYRDGFRIGLSGSQDHQDWLELDQYALKRGGYVVNRIQTVGALDITKENNKFLIDRSNREGLIENLEYDLLKQIVLEFGITLLRSDVIVDVEVEKKRKIAELVADGTGDVEDRLKQASNNISAIKEKVPKELNSHVVELGKHIHFISGQVSKYKEAFSELKETREDILELAGVGTVMHSILHELTRTTSQTRILVSEVAKTADNKTKELLEKLELEIKAINIRLSQLDPLSPSGRMRKGKFDIVKLLKTITDGYKARFDRHAIKIILTVDDSEDLSASVMVNMVKGFFSLAIENLITNSVWWVQQYLKVGESSRIIVIDIDSKARVITFSDNGPGIAGSDKGRVFKPGFSLRPKGNGFGLYIAREVAEYHGAILNLGEPDTEDGRYRTFIIELPME